MKFGNVTYKIAYNSKLNKVCISTMDMTPAKIYCYTRQELNDLIAGAYDFRKEIYQKALEYFQE